MLKKCFMSTARHRLRDKLTAKRGVRVTRMNFQTCGHLQSACYNRMTFVAIASLKAISCSTKSMVGKNCPISCSICMREYTSMKLRGSSHTYRCACSQRLFAINTFFFWPPERSSMSFSNCTLSKSIFLSTAFNRLSSRLFFSANSDNLPDKWEVSWGT